MSERLDKAIEIAKIIHEGQLDKQGVPYINHPLTVASYVESEDAKIVAVLHDTVEDGNGRITIEEIRDIFGNTIADAVDLLTHRDEVPYLDYIKQIKTNKLATEVKLADLKHNTDPSRSPIPRLMERYIKAKEILNEN